MGRAASNRAFTLIETAVAVAVSSVLLLALGSVIMIASRAVPTGDEHVAAGAVVEQTITMLRTDLETAIDIASESNAVHIGVPDRDGDGRGEAVSYSVDHRGVLTRSINLSDPHDLCGGVKQLEYNGTTVSGRTTEARITLHFDTHKPSVRTITVRLLNAPE